MAAAVAELVIGFLQLLATIWLWRCWRDLRAEIRRARRVVRQAAELIGEPEPEPAAPGRHAALARHGRHAASSPVDHGPYTASELNGAPRPGA